MSHLAPAVAERDLRLVALGEEPDQVSQLDLVIPLLGAGPELYFLDLDLLLLALGSVGLLVLLEQEFPEVEDPAYRRIGVR